MKKILSYLAIITFIAVGTVSCSQESLDTSPTTAVSGSGLFTNATTALLPLNGIYRSMYSAGWSTGGNTHQCFGISAYNLMADVMGDDHIMSAQGSGWFWYDCLYNVKSRYASANWRSYDLWNAYYTWISNANYIIAAENTMTGSAQDIAYVIGQAYAIRGYSYFMLAQIFARTYKGHESDKCVPIYTEPTVAGTQGNPRATVSEVYTQIMSDINKACTLLESTYGQTTSTHIDQYVANGIKARICLVMEDWAGARDAAVKAQAGGTLTASVTSGMNSVGQSDVLWGAGIIADQSGIYASFFMHMCESKSFSGYGNTALKQVNKELYAHMGANDIRRAWWNTSHSSGGYQQVKFVWSDEGTYLGDYIWMRTPEMVLTQAEAECRLGNDAAAQTILNNFMKTYRDKSFSTTKTGTQLGATTSTSDDTGSLLEEIIYQRRIELWGEFGRIYDIRRLKQGFTRTRAQGWPNAALLNSLKTSNPESYDWVLTIPQKEFDANTSMDAAVDQNPMGSGV